MTITDVPAILQTLGVAGVLAVGIWWLVNARKLVPRALHDEIVAMYRQTIDTHVATNREQSANIQKLTAAVAELSTAQRDTLAAIRHIVPPPQVTDRMLP